FVLASRATEHPRIRQFYRLEPRTVSGCGFLRRGAPDCPASPRTALRRGACHRTLVAPGNSATCGPLSLCHRRTPQDVRGSLPRWGKASTEHIEPCPCRPC